MRKLPLSLLAAAGLASGLTATASAQRPGLTVVMPEPAGIRLICRDPLEAERIQLTRVRPLDVSDGRALMFDQDPPILAPDYTGTIALRDFTVAGDVPSLQFRHVDGAVEVWPRERTDTVAGRMVSVFQPSWPSSALDRAMTFSRWGWDQPEMLVGEVPGAGDGGASKQILLKIAPANIPNVTVRRVADDVQYSSSVVNIVLPGFGEQIALDGDETGELQRVARRFYEQFEDSYDVMAVVPQRTVLPNYTAVHHIVKNEVRGIGEDLYDRSGQYGSAGRLHGIEVYAQSFATNQNANHETAHQWASYIDWTKLTGLQRAGHQPEAHDPLWATYPSLLGASLAGSRHVINAGGWVIDRSQAPIAFPPLTLYAMGLIPKEQVPDITLFDDQGQFGAAGTPDPGTPVVGGTRTATIFNVVGMEGERSGPTLGDWQRATVIVSRGQLLSQREMNYWTFFAQRLADPNGSGVVSYDGFGSFDLATNRAASLQTGIRPKGGAAIVEPLPVDVPEFGVSDLRYVTLDAPLRTSYGANDRVRISGRLAIANVSDFDRIGFRFRRDEDSQSVPLTVAALGPGGTFSADVPFDGRQGRHKLELFLVQPGATTVTGRLQLSTFYAN